MNEHFNALTPAEAERLAILAEEAGEIVKAACKILRHGYWSFNPVNGAHNRDSLEREIGDLQYIIQLMYECRDIDFENVSEHKINKEKNIIKYLHHQHKENK
jgi:NTP pyrophosphatase (non-canonical NTP hydrolase)